MQEKKEFEILQFIKDDGWMDGWMKAMTNKT
jgi:hypothetical protein